MALADGYDGFLFDLDGVLWLGSEPIPGAAEAVAVLIASGKGAAFLTNNPRARAEDYAVRLRREGIEVGPELVVTAGAVTAALAAASPAAERGAFVIGTDSFKQEVTGAGAGLLDGEDGAGAGIVVVSGHAGFDYGELRIATAALLRGAELFATSRDPTMPMPGGLWPGTGSILAAVETAAGAAATVGGKPERPIFERARALVGGSRVAMVGDRLDSDIEGAAAAGLETILVLTGSTGREEALRSLVRPGQILDSVADLRC
jgi:glycerol-1-phosphatase